MDQANVLVIADQMVAGGVGRRSICHLRFGAINQALTVRTEFTGCIARRHLITTTRPWHPKLQALFRNQLSAELGEVHLARVAQLQRDILTRQPPNFASPFPMERRLL